MSLLPPENQVASTLLSFKYHLIKEALLNQPLKKQNQNNDNKTEFWISITLLYISP